MFASLFSKPKPIKKRILILTKKRIVPYEGTKSPTVITSSGLKNSAMFVVDLLNDLGHVAAVVDVVDNNCIDKEVTEFYPDIVIIEALWVVPEKFDVLKRLHPHIKWVVRLHSDIPFLANEGIAMDWIFKYVERNVIIAVNNTRIDEELKNLIDPDKVWYLPNYYPLVKRKVDIAKKDKTIIDIACFGAIRPMKNQLLQAIAAIIFANDKGLVLRFHINGTRVEGLGEPILRNIRSLFENTHHQLIEHDWLEHDEFLRLIANMDISMQCSLSETFNIVSADAVSQSVPIVVSPEVSWASEVGVANPTSSVSIVEKLKIVWSLRKLVVHKLNYYNLNEFNKLSKEIWKRTIVR